MPVEELSSKVIAKEHLTAVSQELVVIHAMEVPITVSVSLARNTEVDHLEVVEEMMTSDASLQMITITAQNIINS